MRASLQGTRSGAAFVFTFNFRVGKAVHDAHCIVVVHKSSHLICHGYLVLVAADQPDAAVVQPVDVPQGPRGGAHDAHIHCVVKGSADRGSIQHDLPL